MKPQTIKIKGEFTHPAYDVIVYRGVLHANATGKASAFKEMFTCNGWGAEWVDGIYDYHHFHSNAHEVLGIARGRVTVRLGGEDGVDIDLRAGDVVILPAGTGHCRMTRAGDLQVVGAYPHGQGRYDICRSREDKPDIAQRIRRTAKPEYDPVTGGVFLRW